MASLSVIIPAWNAERFLGEAIESALLQTRPADEIIVIDDGSTDGTFEVTKGFGGVCCVRQDHAGVSTARNHGLRLARGDLIAFLDADDRWPADKLEHQSAVLGDNQNLDMVSGWVRHEYQDGSNRLVRTFIPKLCAALIRRRAFERIGDFDQSMLYCEDVDWFNRAREAGLLLALQPRLAVCYRIHDQNMTLELKALKTGLDLSIRKSLARRRANGKTFTRVTMLEEPL